jgi:ABC-2 type transport system permease protein
MISRIARKELIETVRDGRFRVLGAVVLAISVTSLFAGWRHHRDVEAQHAQAQQATRAQWLDQGSKNPHSAAHYGVYAFKPRTRLSMVDTGIDAYVGVAAWLEAHKQNEYKYRPAQDRTAVQRFGELTAAEGFLVLLPLFIVLVTFSAFTGEREQGTLRQLLSLGVRPRDLVIGKAAGIAAALGLVLVPATVAGIVCLALAADDASLMSDLPRAALLGLVYLAYFTIFVAVSLGVSARVKSSRLSLVLLLSFWFANSLIASRAASDLAAVLHPAPSAVEFQTAMDKELADQREIQQRLDARRQELLRRYQATDIEMVPINFRGISLQEGEEHGNEVFDRHYGRLFDIYDRQNHVYQMAGVVAPLLPMRAMSMGLAGTDFAHHRAFVNAAEEYRRMIQRVLNADITENSKPGVVYEAGPELWHKVPAFSYTAPRTGWVVQHYRWSLILMTAWLVGAIWFALSGAAAARVE